MERGNINNVMLSPSDHNRSESQPLCCLSSSRKVFVRDIKSLFNTAPIPRTTTLRGDEGRFGFTLIELLVVVLIIGILAAVALPQYKKAVDKASFTCAMTILKSVTDAQTVAALENGGYPPSRHYFTFNDLNITIPVEDQNCLETDTCYIKCSGKIYGITLRNTETWAGFYFWAGSLERLVYRKGNALHWQLQCASERCKKFAKAFGATDCGNFLCW